jgi:hypothetical protein
MAQYARSLDQGLDTLRQRCRLRLLVAGRQVREHGRLTDAAFQGGADNMPALKRALGQHPDAILWIHGPQPQIFDSAFQFERDRLPQKIPLYGYRVTDGPNELWNELAMAAYVELIPRTGDIGYDLGTAFTARRWTWERTPTAGRPAREPALAALWASAQPEWEIQRRYGVVTPATGAVVLENDRQYEQTGLLKRSASTRAASTPEPATWILLASALAVLIWRHRRRPAKEELC